jgi:hypothetical protein
MHRSRKQDVADPLLPLHHFRPGRVTSNRRPRTTLKSMNLAANAAATVPLWQAVLLGTIGSFVGGLLTLGGVAWTQRAAAKREDIRWQRERQVDNERRERELQDRLQDTRVRIYVDVAEYIHHQESALAFLAGEASDLSKDAELVHPDLLTAQVRLYGAPALRTAWSALLFASEMAYSEHRNSDERTLDGRRIIHSGHDTVLACRAAIQAVMLPIRARIETHREDEASVADEIAFILAKAATTAADPFSDEQDTSRA